MRPYEHFNSRALLGATLCVVWYIIFGYFTTHAQKRIIQSTSFAWHFFNSYILALFFFNSYASLDIIIFSNLHMRLIYFNSHTRLGMIFTNVHFNLHICLDATYIHLLCPPVLPILTHAPIWMRHQFLLMQYHLLCILFDGSTDISFLPLKDL